MRVIINISNRLGGGAFQVAISFVMELLAKDFGRNCYFAGNREILAALENSGVAVDNSRFFEIDNRYYALIHLRLGRIERMVKPDLVFTVFGPAYWRPKAKHLVGFANPYYLNMQGPFIERLRH